MLRVLCAFLLAAIPGVAQQVVSIKVDAGETQGALHEIWSFYGHDEPNYTYAPNGKKLLTELAAMNAEPVYIRTHNLLTSGDGSYALKWGSSNAYTEDAAGRPVFRVTTAYPDVRRPFMPQKSGE